jgi:predicted PurR-regulated permease PerM
MSSFQEHEMAGPRDDERRSRVQKISRYFLIIVLIISMVVFFNLTKIFLVPVLMATVFTTLFYPLFEWLLKKTGRRRNLSAFACCLILLVGLLVPLFAIADLVMQEAISLYSNTFPEIVEMIKGDSGVVGKIKNSTLLKHLSVNNMDWESSLQEVAKQMGNFIARTSRGTFHVVTNLFIMLFTMFYFFRDGERLVRRIKYLSPMDDTYEEALIYRFISVSRATIKGTMLIGMVQGVLGGITLWIFGIGSPVLWGMVMVILSIIPLVGCWLVLYPAAFYLIVTGEFWQGIAIMLITAFIISNIDNFLRPRLVGKDAGMHDLMIFFSTLGGISVYGVMGFIIGPVIAVFFLTILDIYSIEFKTTLDLAQNASFAHVSEEFPAEETVKAIKSES